MIFCVFFMVLLCFSRTRVPNYWIQIDCKVNTNFRNMQIILYKNAYFVQFSTFSVNLSPFVGSFLS